MTNKRVLKVQVGLVHPKVGLVPKGTTLVRYKKGFANITSIMFYVLFFNIGVNVK